MKNILVVGGAGYIGSHACKELHKRGYNPIVFDNLIYGHKSSVKWGDFILGDLADVNQIKLAFSQYDIHAVMHFAAFAYVGESVEEPNKYYKNNVINTLNLLGVMLENKINYFIFSSSCATYGEPQYIPIDEKHPQKPINPYGQTKFMVENILNDYFSAYGLNYVSLRYFNAAGADLDCETGELHEPETHLIPLVLDAAIGKRENIKIFGTDYDTDDGTAVRDYIHVTDLSDAHILALEYLSSGGLSDVFNLGNGNGYSVKEVIDTAKHVTKVDIKVDEVNRRAGDPDKLIGSSTKAMEKLNWRPKHASLEKIIESAWMWHKEVNK